VQKEYLKQQNIIMQTAVLMTKDLFCFNDHGVQNKNTQHKSYTYVTHTKFICVNYSLFYSKRIKQKVFKSSINRTQWRLTYNKIHFNTQSKEQF